MSKKNTGGPAFPGLNATMTGIDSDGQERWDTEPSGGMTLRDYFAAKAMPIVIADWLNTGDVFQDAEIPEVIARDCYILADAMLKAREM